MIINIEKWNNYETKNTDSYSKCCVNVARQVMKNLDNIIIDEEFNPSDLIIKSEHEICESGLTGFMAGCIAEMVIQCHDKGEEFKGSWNKHCGGSGKETGVINPAIITIKS
jgi:hypothetical protein